MKRIPEPDLMDDDEQARAYAFADFEEPHEGFVRAFQRAFPDVTAPGRVLDLGCGPADVCVRFARAFPTCRVDGVDGAEAMLRYGRERLAREGLAERITLHRAYLPHDELAAGAYDVVLSNSLLHHLEDPAVLWQAVRRTASAGARVFIMDLMRPADEETALAFVDTYAKGEPAVLQKDFHASLLAAYTLEEVREQLAAAGLAELQVKAESDRHLLVYGAL